MFTRGMVFSTTPAEFCVEKYVPLMFLPLPFCCLPLLLFAVCRVVAVKRTPLKPLIKFIFNGV